PTEDWLKLVVTSKAISKIKDALKEHKKLIATDGKEIVERKVKQLKLDLNEDVMAQIRTYFDCKTNLDFFYLVGKGSIEPGLIKKALEEKPKKDNGPAPVIHDSKSFEREIKKVRGVDSDQLLIGEDMDRIDYTLAKCCNPIPGDDVFGFVTINEGIKIHRTTCPNAVELMSNYGYRIIKARWTSSKELAFLAGLRITGTDRMGLVQDVTRVISSDLRVNMRSISIDTNETIFEGKIMLFVHDTAHLDQLIKKLEKVEGVVKVDRFDT
ncbi:MAG TPA: DUF5913 domain-containing protein, partial [Catalimonadaceae bacterium]|nr:DUF5913 domain-containing protein [Catalimonadaceae bacterium]